MDHARKIFGRYLGVEIVILISLIFHGFMVWFIPSRGILISILVIAISLYRVTTMVVSQIGILFLKIGKSTDGVKVHSRIRYLSLTLLNLLEVILFGAITIYVIDNLGFSAPFGVEFESRMAALYHCFQLVLLNISIDPSPVSFLGYCIHVFLPLIGLELIVIVLSIVLAISPEDEAYKGNEPSIINYWNWRARFFTRTPWLHGNQLADPIWTILREKKVQNVIDVGCGPGVLALKLADLGLNITGLDISEEMLELAKQSSEHKVSYIRGSAISIPAENGSYDGVLMRMLLHNMSHWQKGIREAFRILGVGKYLIIVEGFPPSEECREFFEDVLSKVHKRVFFTEEHLEENLLLSGFRIISSESVILKQLSVSKWLDSSVRSSFMRKKLLRLHKEMPDPCVQGYNLTVANDDCLIDLSFRIIICEKVG